MCILICLHFSQLFVYILGANMKWLKELVPQFSMLSLNFTKLESFIVPHMCPFRSFVKPVIISVSFRISSDNKIKQFVLTNFLLQCSLFRLKLSNVKICVAYYMNSQTMVPKNSLKSSLKKKSFHRWYV